MIALMKGSKGVTVVAAFLILQVVLFWLSMGELMQISFFCTGPASSPLGLLFGLIHLLILGLLLLGVVSLPVPDLRLPYVGLLAAALLALPIQASLVQRHHLTCDAP